MDLFNLTATAVAAVQQAFTLIEIEDNPFAMILELMEQDTKKRGWGGSKPGKAPNKKRDFAAVNALIEQHYFSGADLVYDEKDLKRHFGVHHEVFNIIFKMLEGTDLFIQREQGFQKDPGITPSLG